MRFKEENILAIIAAIGDRETANFAWNKLMKSTTVEKLDSISCRFLPTVYLNIGKQDPNFDPKVRGLYLYNTAKNMHILRQVKEVFKQMNEKNISYRVLKGFAISLKIESLGFRVMGDIDIVIERADYSDTCKILNLCGFTNKYINSCKNNVNSAVIAKTTFSSESGVEIDLHVAEIAFPSLLFKQMFNSPGETILYEHLPIQIPNVDQIIQHSLIHSKQYAAITDRWQSLVDISVLYKRYYNSLEKSKSWIVNNEISRMPAVISGLSTAIESRFDGFTDSALLRVLYYLNVLCSQVFFWKIFSLKRFVVKIETQKSSGFRVIKYLLWQYFGCKATLEQVIVEKLGGFLRGPLDLSERGLDYPVKKLPNQFTLIRNALETRIHFLLPKDASKFDFHFHSKDFTNHLFEIFCNGKLVGNSKSNEKGDFGVSYFKAPQSVEISIRNPVHSCLNCQPDFDDLTIRIQ